VSFLGPKASECRGSVQSERVAVTGLGVQSVFGTGVDAFFAGLCAGATAIRPGRFGWAATLPGELDLLTVAREALEDARLAPQDLRLAALVLGTTTGGMARWLSGAVGPGFAYHGPAADLAHRLGLGGPVVVPAAACASGTAALGVALDLVRSERAEVVLCGGADVLSDFVARGFQSLAAMDPAGPARPFDRHRAGMSLGEGAALLVVQPAATARRSPRAELRGFGLTGDGVHRTAPDREGKGLARAIDAALRDAGLPAAAVEMISAHGTGTMFNDAMEGQGFVRAGVAHAPVHGVKGAIGHALGAAGALEAVLCVRALETGRLPATCGLAERDPAIALDVTTEARPLRAQVALSTSSGFGGVNAALLLGRPG
jgi:3-oxoacyl-[acyl-carrier-protein] synthase II